jgi:hypothetical protein
MRAFLVIAIKAISSAYALIFNSLELISLLSYSFLITDSSTRLNKVADSGSPCRIPVKISKGSVFRFSTNNTGSCILDCNFNKSYEFIWNSCFL